MAASAAEPAPSPEAAPEPSAEAPPIARATEASTAPAAPVRHPPEDGRSPRALAQPRPAGEAGSGVLAKAPHETGRAGGEALPAQDQSDAPGTGEGSPAPAAPPQGTAAPAPSATPHPAADRAATGAQQALPADARSGEDLSRQQSGGEQRRPEERLAPGAVRFSALAAHGRPSAASAPSSRTTDLETGAPNPTAGAAAPRDGAVAPTPSVQPAPAAAANAPQLTARAELGEMIDAIHATIELAARRGATQARIALQPEELGEIRIHLSQSADGIVARLTAATPAAAQALASGRGELHQSLSSLGATLLQLDIGMFESREGRRQEIAGEPGSGRTAAAPTEEDESIAATGGATADAAPSGSALGALVDVLA